MTDLPRYRIDYVHRDLIPDRDGEFVEWGDVSARLQQLEAEKATLARRLASAEQGCRLTEVEMPNGSVCLAPCVIEGCQYDELETCRAALAETRDALHQLQTLLERLHGWDAMDAQADGNYWRREIRNAIGEVARVDKQADSVSVLPQPRVGDTSADR